MLGLQSLNLDMRLWKVLDTLSYYVCFLRQPLPIHSNFGQDILHLCALAILWKNLVFCSPSFNQVSLDFYLHMVSSDEAHLLYSNTTNLLVSDSLTERTPLSLES